MAAGVTSREGLVRLRELIHELLVANLVQIAAVIVGTSACLSCFSMCFCPCVLLGMHVGTVKSAAWLTNKNVASHHQ